MKRQLLAGLTALSMLCAGVLPEAVTARAAGLGNVNGDGAVNASDAAVILIASAAMGAGGDSGLTDAQMQAANVNGDTAVNASDAAVILIYAAEVGAGSTATLEQFLASQQGEPQEKTQEEIFKEYADEVVKLVNEERAKAGLKPVYAVPALNECAKLRAEECTIRIDATHLRPDGRDCTTVMTDAGIPFVANGENIAEGYYSPEEVMESWMSSDGHKSNILRTSHEYIGVGVAEEDGVLYWVQIFTGGKTLSGGYLPE